MAAAAAAAPGLELKQKLAHHALVGAVADAAKAAGGGKPGQKAPPLERVDWSEYKPLLAHKHPSLPKSAILAVCQRLQQPFEQNDPRLNSYLDAIASAVLHLDGGVFLRPRHHAMALRTLLRQWVAYGAGTKDARDRMEPVLDMVQARCAYLRLHGSVVPRPLQQLLCW